MVFLQQQNIVVLPWLSKSSHLNLSQHDWGKLNRSAHADHKTNHSGRFLTTPTRGVLQNSTETNLMHYHVNTTLSTIPVSYGILNPWKIYPGFNIPYSILDENWPRGQYTMGFKIPYDTRYVISTNCRYTRYLNVHIIQVTLLTLHEHIGSSSIITDYTSNTAYTSRTHWFIPHY